MEHKTLSRWYIEFYRLIKKYLMNSNYRGLIFLLIITSIIILTSCAVEQKKPVTDSLNKSIPETERKIQYECSKIRDKLYRLKWQIGRLKQNTGVVTDSGVVAVDNQPTIDKLNLEVERLESRASLIGCTK